MEHLNKYHRNITLQKKYTNDKGKEDSYTIIEYGNNANEFMPIYLNALNEIEKRLTLIEKENVILKQQIDLFKKNLNIPPPPPTEPISTRIKKPILFNL